ncbi:MAG: DUF3043 domain-containing protein [Micromonosporaceae bacterium]|nr:DUF3043 domain-containing protein [Micromonosporaceae bacterium]
MFRRKPVDLVEDTLAESGETVVPTSLDPQDAPEDEAAPSARPGRVPEDQERRSKAYTPKKGEATPKRVVSRRRPVAPPADRKEALRRARARQRTQREEQRQGMMAGDEKYLMLRDRGPIRRLARDVVDSRRNAATFFFIGLFVVLIGSNRTFPVPVQAGANALFVVLFAATVIDSVLVVRKVRRLAAQRFPNETTGMRFLGFYIVMRTVSFRRMRVPKPQVKVGEKV